MRTTTRYLGLFLAIGEPQPSGDGLNAFLGALRAAKATSYLMKEGTVGGSDPDRSDQNQDKAADHVSIPRSTRPCSFRLSAVGSQCFR